jgi:hypothetical protein
MARTTKLKDKKGHDMKKLSIAAIAGVLALSGCADMSPTQRGTATGAGIGAGLGGIIGAATGGGGGGRALGGAAIGGAIGAVAGNISIGHNSACGMA